MKKKNRILITGGCGFLGINLVDFLLKKSNSNINILDLNRDKSGRLDELEKECPKRIAFYKGSITEMKDVKKALKKCDFVVHLAAQAGVASSQDKALKDAKINILGTLNLLEAGRKNGIKKFIFTSSAAVLGEQKTPLKENQVPRPISPYGASKLAGEGYCGAYASSFNLKTVVLRLSNLYGPHSLHKKNLIHKCVKQILGIEKKKITINGDGKQTRDFIYVEDVCRAIFLSLTKEIPNSFNIFHVGTNVETKVNTVIKKLKEITDKEVKTSKGPAKKGDIKESCLDFFKLKKELGWYPRYNLKKGLAKTIKWYKDYIFLKK